MSLRAIATLFNLLDEKWPADNGYRHQIQPSKEGHALQLSIRRDGQWSYLEVEEEDLDRTPEEIIACVESVFAAQGTKSA